jgi:hypothetical protein
LPQGGQKREVRWREKKRKTKKEGGGFVGQNQMADFFSSPNLHNLQILGILGSIPKVITHEKRYKNIKIAKQTSLDQDL